ncbi:hypothetical protein BTO04_12295 [Polaribacter sp. SA4-10]|uniref:T9SS type A sorting domain-containing protein n=1 Tax=Polaribacter sp. SA4-10 TaxID=754397 RepID=UPI000B3C19F7|nr:T9SS type A sorting domain-containing protein [Polaribacter sp. SA4-10]ARV07421.1 hypothetical protein BTO04_12295 [Polaribacter sp. SA4-10]
MKTKISKFSFVVLIYFLIQTINAQDPNWSVNTANYQYSMTFTSFLNINGTILKDQEDKVAAFVNGEIRGVANIEYVASANKYVAYLSVYANTDLETINFKIYNSTADIVIDINKTESFKIDGSMGGVFQSYSIASPQLNENGVFNSFSFLGISALETAILSDKINIILPKNTDISSLTAVFETSTNSKVFVDQTIQTSGSVSRDFIAPIVYNVLSEDEATFTAYEILVSIDSSVAPTSVVISTTQILNTNLNPVTLDVVFSNVVSGLELTDFLLNNAVISSLSTLDSKSYKVDIIPLSEGAFSIQVPAEVVLDENNNLAEISNKLELVYDISKPIINNISVHSDAGLWWFIVTFSEYVLNVDSSDFELEGIASSGLSIASVEQISNTAYKIEIANSNTHVGVISVQLKSSTDILDDFGNSAIQTDFESYFLNNGALSNNALTKTKNYVLNYDFEAWLNPFSLNSWSIERGDETQNTYSQVSQEKSETRGSSSETALRYFVTTKSKGFLKTSLPIAADSDGRYFFGVWLKAVTVGDKISIGVNNNTQILTDIYTATNTNWNYVVKYFDANMADQITPVIIPETENVTFYIDDTSLKQGLAGSSIEWNAANGIVKAHTDFFETEADSGKTYVSISEEANVNNIHNGLKSLKVVTTSGASASNKGIVSFKSNTTVGNRFQHPELTKREYQTSVWVKSETIADVFYALNVDGVNMSSSKITLPVNTWIQVFSPVVSLDGSNASEIEMYPKLYFTTPNTNYYVDDFFLDWDAEGELNSVVWSGSIDSNWSNVSNWNSDLVLPSTNDNVYIPSGLINYPAIAENTSVSIKNLNIDGSLTAENGASLIVKEVSNGEITYSLKVNDTKWHLVSSPVVGETYDTAWVDNNLIDDSSSSNNNLAIASYINTIDLDGDWVYPTIGDSGDFNNGQGYSIKKDEITNSDISFTGAIKIEDFFTTIDKGFGDENKWNLVGNPFPSYILVGDLLALNLESLSNTHLAVYVWDNSKNSEEGGYKPLLGEDYIHPGQGFFVSANNENLDNFTISRSLQRHNVSGLFYKSNTDSSIKLIISDGKKNRATEINYSLGKTTKLDPAFDIGTFTGAPSLLSIYTHLVNNSKGVDFVRQALPRDFENLIVPIGINAEAGKEISFSAESLNLPADIKVFLEDRETGVFSSLGENNSNYKVMLSKSLKGIGRFYLHTSRSSLNLRNVVLQNISVYKINKNTLRIVGLPNGNSFFKLFTLLGKELISFSFESSGVKDVLLPRLAVGVYFIQIQTNNGWLRKKVILE